ncbi:MAG: glycosyltransferase [Treponemataceae bacterium]
MFDRKEKLLAQMKIAICTMGTRGDVQPYVILAKELIEEGHCVQLATAKNFASLVQSYGVDFIPIEADYESILNSDDGKKMLKVNPFAIRRNLEKWIYPLIKDSLCTFYKLASQSDKVIYHPKTLCDCFADQFAHKMIRAMLVPVIEPTREFANPALSGIVLPPFLYRVSYNIMQLSTQMLKKPIEDFRETVNLPKKYTKVAVQSLYTISEHFLPKPKDFCSSSIFTGFWFDTSKKDLPLDVKDFMQKKPTLVITFGSMPFKCQFDLAAAIEKITETHDLHFVVVKGWGFSKTAILEKNPRVKIIENAPYDKLFAYAKAIIHHGGIGTTAECLRAGKPCMICPVFYPVGDQQFWGNQIAKKGLGVKPIPLGKLTEKKFISRVNELLTQPIFYENAQKMQSVLLQENGIKNAVTIIYSA